MEAADMSMEDRIYDLIRHLRAHAAGRTHNQSCSLLPASLSGRRRWWRWPNTGGTGMTGAPSRRATLRYGGLAALAGLVTPAIAEANPDADLIHLCDAHAALMDAVNNDPRDGDEDPNWPPYERSLRAISTAKPTTMEGVRAKALAAKAEARRPDGTEEGLGRAERPAGDRGRGA
jgi:hypothetical protein